MKFPSFIFSSDHPLRRFSAQVALFLGVTLAAQSVIYLATGGDHDNVPQELRILRGVDNGKTDILYFGDSVITETGGHGPGMETIPELLQARMPGRSVTTIAHGAYHPGVYVAFADYLLRRGRPPRQWVIPINMRSFSAGWDLRPEYQFQKEKILLDHDSIFFRILFRPLQVFKTFNMMPVKQDDFENAPVMDGDRVAGQVRNFLPQEGRPANAATLARMFVFNYMYALRPEHRKVRELAALCRTLKSHSMEPLFYVTPVDYQTGNQCLGPRFQARIEANVEVLKQALAREGCEPVDLLLLLGSKDFNWRVVNSPNEHLTWTGRSRVADQLRRVFEARPSI